jgi:hypothetical protein
MVASRSLRGIIPARGLEGQSECHGLRLPYRIEDGIAFGRVPSHAQVRRYRTEVDDVPPVAIAMSMVCLWQWRQSAGDCRRKLDRKGMRSQALSVNILIDPPHAHEGPWNRLNPAGYKSVRRVPHARKRTRLDRNETVAQRNAGVFERICDLFDDVTDLGTPSSGCASSTKPGDAGAGPIHSRTFTGISGSYA